MKFVVGLGNPGIKYQDTRHNLGFLVVDQLAKRYDIAVERNLCDAWVGAGFTNGEKVIVAKPQTFMNRSGAAVESLLHEYGGTANDLVIVYDDLDLPFGRMRIRPRRWRGWPPRHSFDHGKFGRRAFLPRTSWHRQAA